MAKFNKVETGIEGLYILEPVVFGDERGFFLESYSKRDFEEIGIPYEFVQDNHSKSKKGVLRGMHFQTQYSQDKLVRVVAGSVYDVVVDLRKESKTFGKYFGVLLTAQNKKQFFVPKGFAHGFLTLEDDTEFLYKCTEYYMPQFDSGILWNDSEVGIDWKLSEFQITESELTLSEKDKKQQTLAQFIESAIEIK
ncbi:MAG: dTDP-4-dehydrorhamnose 3,5-epimerase [Fusobacteriaceae bacterium]